ncbi:hypothetical protein LAZ40_04570 [Cereibacter sphaeroides]|uniref:hypothetical protein n=1 Tax=Cereibacter sphaeroides TaxID=1063 RepID=UPI001F2BADE9|nr:hypothetical protein [Cereibacter sphaeroides]MCE6958330.1 hypothetical protein [Cereibacter sphaeroides]MCE6971152.1 hypothetical protein [Cereibacter sphaeroides]
MENERAEQTFALRLSPEAVRTIEEISRLRRGAAVAEVVRHALGTEIELLRLLEDGARIIARRPGHGPAEIVFR